MTTRIDTKTHTCYYATKMPIMLLIYLQTLLVKIMNETVAVLPRID